MINIRPDTSSCPSCHCDRKGSTSVSSFSLISAAEQNLRLEFPTAVIEEAERLGAPLRPDVPICAIPLVTIDGADARDLTMLFGRNHGFVKTTRRCADTEFSWPLPMYRNTWRPAPCLIKKPTNAATAPISPIVSYRCCLKL